jgi:predicted exporter
MKGYFFCGWLALTLFVSAIGVETDLYSLADAHDGGALKEIAAGLAHQGRVMVEGAAERPPIALAQALAAELGQRPAGRFADTLAYLARHKDGLLAPETRARLQAGRFSEVTDDVLAQLFGPVPPLFPVKDDPFLLATGYALSLQSHLAEGWTLKDGFPACERAERAYLLVTVDLSDVAPARIAEFLVRAQEFNAGQADFGVAAAAQAADGLRIWCSGPPFHAARTAERAKREINLLSVLSLTAVVGFGWLLLRTFRFLPMLLATLGMAALFACAALFAIFPRPHVLTFVFGTSLIGLSVDYVYHAWAVGGAQQVKRPLACALATTIASFAPLLLSAVDVLRQMAVFTIAGLVAVWVWVMVSMGKIGNVANDQCCQSSMLPVPNWLLKLDIGNSGYWQHLRRLVGMVVLVLAAGGFWKLKIVHSPTAFYRPDAYLAASERRVAELNPGGTGLFAYVRGKTLQDALEREEAAGLKGVSAVIPSLRRQRENRALIGQLYAREGATLLAKTGLKANERAVMDSDASLLNPETMTDERLQGLLRAAWTGNGLVSPCPKGFMPHDPDILVLDPRQELEDLFARFTSATLRLLGVSLVVLVALMAFLFRRKAPRIAAPVLAALAATAGTLGWLGIPITFFTLLCVFVLAGLGIDYVIFQTTQAEGNLADARGHTTSRAVFYSFLTSFVGLGALAFTDFAVTRDMGVTFAVGLAFAYVFARFPVFGYNRA